MMIVFLLLVVLLYIFYYIFHNHKRQAHFTLYNYLFVTVTHLEVTKFVDEFCDIINERNEHGLSRLDSFWMDKLSYMENNHKRLGDELATRGVSDTLCRFIRFVAGKSVGAARGLYRILWQLTLESSTLCWKLCEGRVPAAASRH